MDPKKPSKDDVRLHEADDEAEDIDCTIYDAGPPMFDPLHPDALDAANWFSPDDIWFLDDSFDDSFDDLFDDEPQPATRSPAIPNVPPAASLPTRKQPLYGSAKEQPRIPPQQNSYEGGAACFQTDISKKTPHKDIEEVVSSSRTGKLALGRAPLGTNPTDQLDLAPGSTHLTREVKRAPVGTTPIPGTFDSLLAQQQCTVGGADELSEDESSPLEEYMKIPPPHDPMEFVVDSDRLRMQEGGIIITELCRTGRASEETVSRKNAHDDARKAGPTSQTTGVAHTSASKSLQRTNTAGQMLRKPPSAQVDRDAKAAPMDRAITQGMLGFSKTAPTSLQDSLLDLAPGSAAVKRGVKKAPMDTAPIRGMPDFPLTQQQSVAGGTASSEMRIGGDGGSQMGGHLKAPPHDPMKAGRRYSLQHSVAASAFELSSGGPPKQNMAGTSHLSIGGLPKESTAGTSHSSSGGPPKDGKRKRVIPEPKFKVYHTPSLKDVLMGRGGKTNKHLGNLRFHIEKVGFRQKFLEAEKSDKAQHSLALVETVHRWGGKFLKQDTDGRWYEVPLETARTKATQALRDSKFSPEEHRAKQRMYKEIRKAMKMQRRGMVDEIKQGADKGKKAEDK